jgi:alanine racemase
MTYDFQPVLPRGNGPWAHIDTRAITHNLEWVKRRVQSHAGVHSRVPRIWAVVKADAYGHGISHALSALWGADGLCVTTFNDVVLLRQCGWGKPILLLSLWGISETDLLDPSLGQLHVVADDTPQVEMIERWAQIAQHNRSKRSSLHVWVRAEGKLKTLGFQEEEYRSAFLRLRALADAGLLAEVGHLNHYAASEDAHALNLERQAFLQTTHGLSGPYCTGNSGALCGEGPGLLKETSEWLRCGLLLYGASALAPITGPELGLVPAMSLQARLLSVRQVRAGVTVGYGESYRAERDTFIGTVGIGYGHGVPRRLWQRGTVLAGHDGREVPLAGRVAMDCLTVDLGPDPIERVGDIMTIWGRAPNGTLLPVEKTAAACDTIAAALWTGLTSRVPLIAATSAQSQQAS